MGRVNRYRVQRSYCVLCSQLVKLYMYRKMILMSTMSSFLHLLSYYKWQFAFWVESKYDVCCKQNSRCCAYCGRFVFGWETFALLLSGVWENNTSQWQQDSSNFRTFEKSAFQRIPQVPGWFQPSSCVNVCFAVTSRDSKQFRPWDLAQFPTAPGNRACPKGGHFIMWHGHCSLYHPYPTPPITASMPIGSLARTFPYDSIMSVFTAAITGLEKQCNSPHVAQHWEITLSVWLHQHKLPVLPSAGTIWIIAPLFAGYWLMSGLTNCL